MALGLEVACGGTGANVHPRAVPRTVPCRIVPEHEQTMRQSMPLTYEKVAAYIRSRDVRQQQARARGSPQDTPRVPAPSSSAGAAAGDTAARRPDGARGSSGKGSARLDFGAWMDAIASPRPAAGRPARSVNNSARGGRSPRNQPFGAWVDDLIKAHEK